mmetsp:Transcript_111232/g.346717  ORF Transcript_111232/g.346717 Transcript_111232/m.346717 type:complete len:212 (-) Transcript_111232:87-722(-)
MHWAFGQRQSPGAPPAALPPESSGRMPRRLWICGGSAASALWTAGGSGPRMLWKAGSAGGGAPREGALRKAGGPAKEPGRGAPHLGQDGLLAKTVFRLFTHCVFGHCQSPGCFAFLAVPHEGQDGRLPKTILVWLMQVVFGHCQSSGMSPPCMPFSAFGGSAYGFPTCIACSTPTCIACSYPECIAGSSLEEPHFGQVALLPNTIRVWFTH